MWKLREALDQSGLAYAGFARNEHDTAASGFRRAEPFGQVGQLALTLKQVHQLCIVNWMWIHLLTYRKQSRKGRAVPARPHRAQSAHRPQVIADNRKMPNIMKFSEAAAKLLAMQAFGAEARSFGQPQAANVRGDYAHMHAREFELLEQQLQQTSDRFRRYAEP
jgi:hypothetical protein